MNVVDLGLCDYEKAYLAQMGYVEDRFSGKESKDILLFVEHPDVYTFGRKYREEIPPFLPNVQVVERGGESTFHNPGQLVCYPIFKLEEGKRDLHLFMRFLENRLIDLLNQFGIKGESREKKTGVWIQGKEKKIASIGIAVKHWVTYHGLALNVKNDLTGFSRINPCGFDATIMTSMEKELSRSIQMEDVKTALTELFLN